MAHEFNPDQSVDSSAGLDRGGVMASKPDQDASIEHLAALPRLEYEQQRRSEAKRLGIRASVLDQEVRRIQKVDDDTAQGSSLALDDPDPWPDSVDGAELLNDIVEAVRLYLVVPDGAAEVLALWAVHAHTFEAFYHSPRIAISSPEKQCGKTVALDILECLTPRAVRTENVTTAVLFRLVDAHRPTLLVDEADTFLAANEELRGALNAGHRRGGRHLRCEGDDNEVRAFSTFGPVTIAGIGNLPGTLVDRSIAITMRRALSDERIRPFRADRAPEMSVLCQKTARWAEDNYATLQSHDPTVPDWMFNRQADNWRPLFAIADLAGGEWPQRARAVATTICQELTDESSLRVQLLIDIHALFETHSAEQLKSASIASELGEMEERPWSDWKGKPITAPKIARLLKPFKIVPGTIRDGVTTAKGYKLSDFSDAVQRYAGFQTVTTSQATDSKAFGHFQNVTRGPDVTLSKALKPKESNGCDVVTVWDEDNGDEAVEWSA